MKYFRSAGGRYYAVVAIDKKVRRFYAKGLGNCNGKCIDCTFKELKKARVKGACYGMGYMERDPEVSELKGILMLREGRDDS